jgi:hypothetical protein
VFRTYLPGIIMRSNCLKSTNNFLSQTTHELLPVYENPKTVLSKSNSKLLL